MKLIEQFIAFLKKPNHFQRQEMSQIQFTESYKAGRRDFRNIHLFGADLSDLVLEDLNFQGSALHNVKFPMKMANINLADTVLCSADFTLRDLSQAVFTNANLTGANLSQANLFGAQFSQANLSQANLSWSYLMNANLSLANLCYANLHGADLSGTNLAGSKHLNAEFFQARLPYNIVRRKGLTFKSSQVQTALKL